LKINTNHIIQHKKKYTLKKRYKPTLKAIFLREYFFLPPKKNFFPPFLFLRNLFSQRTGLVLNRTDMASNVNRCGQSVCGLDTSTLRSVRTASGNSGFKKLAVQWLIEHSTSHQHLWWLDSFVLRNRQLLKPANRYRQG